MLLLHVYFGGGAGLPHCLVLALGYGMLLLHVYFGGGAGLPHCLVLALGSPQTCKGGRGVAFAVSRASSYALQAVDPPKIAAGAAATVTAATAPSEDGGDSRDSLRHATLRGSHSSTAQGVRV
jgi:hypothetical protein